MACSVVGWRRRSLPIRKADVPSPAGNVERPRSSAAEGRLTRRRDIASSKKTGQHGSDELILLTGHATVNLRETVESARQRLLVGGGTHLQRALAGGFAVGGVGYADC